MFLIPLGLKGLTCMIRFCRPKKQNEIHLCLKRFYSIWLLSPTFINMDRNIFDKTLILVFIFPL